MKPNVIQLLEMKGLRIPERDCERLTNAWHQFEFQRNNLDQRLLKESDIAVNFFAGDHHVEK